MWNKLAEQSSIPKLSLTIDTIRGNNPESVSSVNSYHSDLLLNDHIALLHFSWLIQLTVLMFCWIDNFLNVHTLLETDVKSIVNSAEYMNRYGRLDQIIFSFLIKLNNNSFSRFRFINPLYMFDR